jgi:hypothetical protein
LFWTISADFFSFQKFGFVGGRHFLGLINVPRFVIKLKECVLFGIHFVCFELQSVPFQLIIVAASPNVFFYRETSQKKPIDMSNVSHFSDMYSNKLLIEIWLATKWKAERFLHLPHSLQFCGSLFCAVLQNFSTFRAQDYWNASDYLE